MYDERHRTPIIEACALELPIVDAKPKRLDEMESASGCGAESCYVAGIRRDFRFHERDMQRHDP